MVRGHDEGARADVNIVVYDLNVHGSVGHFPLFKHMALVVDIGRIGIQPGARQGVGGDLVGGLVGRIGAGRRVQGDGIGNGLLRIGIPQLHIAALGALHEIEILVYAGPFGVEAVAQILLEGEGVLGSRRQLGAVALGAQALMVVIFAALLVVFLSGGILVLIPVLDDHQPGRIQALQFGAVVVHRPQLGPGGDGGDGLAVYHRRGHAVVLILIGAAVNGNADVQLVGGSALGIVLPVHQLPGGVFHAGLFVRKHLVPLEAQLLARQVDGGGRELAPIDIRAVGIRLFGVVIRHLFGNESGLDGEEHRVLRVIAADFAPAGSGPVMGRLVHRIAADAALVPVVGLVHVPILGIELVMGVGPRLAAVAVRAVALGQAAVGAPVAGVALVGLAEAGAAILADMRAPLQALYADLAGGAALIQGLLLAALRAQPAFAALADVVHILAALALLADEARALRAVGLILVDGAAIRAVFKALAAAFADCIAPVNVAAVRTLLALFGHGLHRQKPHHHHKTQENAQDPFFHIFPPSDRFGFFRGIGPGPRRRAVHGSRLFGSQGVHHGGQIVRRYRAIDEVVRQAVFLGLPHRRRQGGVRLLIHQQHHLAHRHPLFDLIPQGQPLSQPPGRVRRDLHDDGIGCHAAAQAHRVRRRLRPAHREIRVAACQRLGDGLGKHKFVAMNLKKMANWKWKEHFLSWFFHLFSLFVPKPRLPLAAQPGFSTG